MSGQIKTLLRRRPKIARTISTTAAKYRTRGFDHSRVSVCSGDQWATKSPPGPNVQSGSMGPLCLGVIFVPSLILTLHSKRSSAVVSIGKARGMTQTKTEQNRRLLEFFYALSIAVLIVAKIWDAIRKKSEGFVRVCQLSLKWRIHRGLVFGLCAPAWVQGPVVLDWRRHLNVRNFLSPTYLMDQSMNRAFTESL